MTFDQIASKSVSPYPALVIAELDIGKLNIQWVNYGAGIWAFNTDGMYSWVDSSLLSGFTAFDYANIGSVYVDGLFITQVYTLAEVTTVDHCFFWDRANNTLYIKIHGYDEPFIHKVIVGVTYGYSYSDISPEDSEQVYEARLKNEITINAERDPMFFGRIAYVSGNVDLINADGNFDSFPDENDIYGQEVRFLFGYSNLSFDDFKLLSRMLVENVSLDEESFSLSLVDKRKHLSKKVNYTCEEKNALDAIVELLEESYGYTYTSLYYNTTVWNELRKYAPNITIAYDDEDDKVEVIEIIEEICTSIFGIFISDEYNRFSFKYIGSPVEYALPIEITKVSGTSLPSSYETSRIVVGTTCHIYYSGGGGALYHAVATDPDFSVFTGTAVTNIAACRFPYLMYLSGTTVLLFTHLVDQGPIYVYSATDYVTFSALNGGNPVFTCSTVASSIYRYAWNPALVFKGTVLSMYLECGKAGDQSDVGLGYLTDTYSRITAGTCNFASNASSVHVIPNGGNPYAYYSASNDSVLVVAGKINFETPNYWEIKAWYTSGMTSLDSPNSYTESEYFDFSYPDMHTADPDLSNTLNNRVVMNYMYNQSISKIAYIEEDNLDALYLAVKAKSAYVIPTPTVTIKKADILNHFSIEYDTSEVISSVLIGYDKTWSNNDYVYTEKDEEREQEVLNKYKTYNDKTIDTLLDYKKDADYLAQRFMDYSETVHGKFSITVPMGYHTLEIGDRAYVEIYRSNISMLGTKECEVMGKTYNLAQGNISFRMRIV